MPPNKALVIEYWRYMRAHYGITQEEAANALCIRKSALSKWENHHDNLPQEKLDTIHRFLYELGITQLFQPEDITDPWGYKEFVQHMRFNAQPDEEQRRRVHAAIYGTTTYFIPRHAPRNEPPEYDFEPNAQPFIPTTLNDINDFYLPAPQPTPAPAKSPWPAITRAAIAATILMLLACILAAYLTTPP